MRHIIIAIALTLSFTTAVKSEQIVCEGKGFGNFDQQLFPDIFKFDTNTQDKVGGALLFGAGKYFRVDMVDSEQGTVARRMDWFKGKKVTLTKIEKGQECINNGNKMFLSKSNTACIKNSGSMTTMAKGKTRKYKCNR